MPTHAYLLEVPVAGGNPILVEVTDQVVDDLGPASRTERIIRRAGGTLESALAELTPAMTALSNWAKDSAPDEFAVEFGLKLGGQTSVVVASGTAEVNFTVTMTWKK
jgi:NTP-dependent ternary system trypsin peptidase co-occuring protein